jgi:hypothetical protein
MDRQRDGYTERWIDREMYTGRDGKMERQKDKGE